MDWTPTREEALHRLEIFLNRAGDYASQRNFDRGAGERSNVSLLSPYLRHRLITEEEVWNTVLNRHDFSKVEKFLQEVVWRTYWKGWLERRPSVWDEWVQSPRETDKHPGLERALAGETGIDPFDEWVQELKEHNYLHNHTRMWFASIWIFTLGLPWQPGAAFFLEHLYDGDAASNTLGWRWVAGIQTPGKHYLARRNNIQRYTEGRLDPGDCLNEEAEPIPATGKPPTVDPVLPQPIPEDPPGERDAIFLTSDDLAPETLFDGQSFQALAGGRPEEIFPNTPPESEKVTRFRRNAIRSTLERLSRSWGEPGQWLPRATAPEILEWAAAHHIRRLWIAHPPVGPTRAPLLELAEELRGKGIETRWYAREWDRRLHPYAKAGFFRFKKEAIPDLLGDKR